VDSPRFVRPAAAALALAALLSAPPLSPAAASTGAQLLNVCAPPAGPPTAACYAYVQAVIDDSNLVGADVDVRFASEFGLFCTPPNLRIDDAVAAVANAIRSDPTLATHNASIAVRLALAKAYRCPPEPPPAAPK